MTELSRRAVVTAAAAVGAAATLPLTGAGTARAQAAAGSKQQPGFYRYKVGDIEVTAVTDGIRQFPLPDNFVRNAKKEEVSAALEKAFLPKDQMIISFTPLVLNTGGKRVVIDTGNGPAQGSVGQFQTNLAASGVDPAAVDTVIISHFHGDHINGLRKADGSLAYPNAEILVPETEWAFWMDDAKMSAAPDGMKPAFQNVRRVFKDVGEQLTKYSWDKEIAPGVTAVATVGHTPGHTSFVVASGNGKLFVQSDVTNNPYLFVRNPGWHAIFDMDGAKAEETRRRVFDMVAAERLMLAGFHFPFPAVGHIEKDGSRYEFVPTYWSPVL